MPDFGNSTNQVYVIDMLSISGINDVFNLTLILSQIFLYEL